MYLLTCCVAVAAGAGVAARAPEGRGVSELFALSRLLLLPEDRSADASERLCGSSMSVSSLSSVKRSPQLACQGLESLEFRLLLGVV